MRTVRLATEADAAGILAVYAPYIRDTAITFETETPSLDAFRCRMASIIGDYPYLVVEEDGSIVGVQKEAGYKLGAWHDVAWLRMAIGDFSAAPEPRVPLSAMDPDQVAEVLTAAEDALARLG